MTPKFKVAEALQMGAVLLIAVDNNGVEQMFIRLNGEIGGEERCMILQRNLNGELCRMLTKEEVELYDPVLYSELGELVKRERGWSEDTLQAQLEESRESTAMQRTLHAIVKSLLSKEGEIQ